MPLLTQLSGVLLAGPGRPAIALLLIAAVTLLLIAPVPVYGQLGAIAVTIAANSVVAIIQGVVGGLLQVQIGILGKTNVATQKLSDLWQKLVYPPDAIAKALSLAARIANAESRIVSAVHSIRILSANLSNPVNLENLMRNHSVNDFGQFEAAFHQNFQQVPPPGDMAPEDRNVLDMSDTLAMGTLEQLKASDDSVDESMLAATIIEQEAANTAPGSASYLVGAGMLAAIGNQVMIQRLAAAELREEAAHLALASTRAKRNTIHAGETRSNDAEGLK